MAEREFSYLPNVHPHNHNNIGLKNIQVTYYLSFTTEQTVKQYVSRMDAILDRMANEALPTAECEQLKQELAEVRRALVELEYFDMGSGQDERQSEPLRTQ